VQQISPDLPPGDYVVTLDPSGKDVIFTSATTQAAFQAVIRELPLPLPRPVALMTASELCLAAVRTQICAVVPTRPPGELVRQLRNAATSLEVDPDSFALDLAVSTVEGETQLDACARAFNRDQPDYSACTAVVVAVPAVADGAFKAPDEQGTITGIGLLIVFKDIREEIFSDPELTKPVERLPSGSYLVYEVLRDGDKQIADGVRATRVLLSGRSGNFYLPAVSGGRLIGKALLGAGPAGENEAAAAANLLLRERCFFKAGQCPWHR